MTSRATVSFSRRLYSLQAVSHRSFLCLIPLHFARTKEPDFDSRRGHSILLFPKLRVYKRSVTPPDSQSVFSGRTCSPRLRRSEGGADHSGLSCAAGTVRTVHTAVCLQWVVCICIRFHCVAVVTRELLLTSPQCSVHLHKAIAHL